MSSPQQQGGPSATVLTVGHSNRTLEDFLSLLHAFDISAVADVRRYPGSQKFPHFGQEALRRALEAEGIEYCGFEALGGRRHGPGRQGSLNVGLKSQGFRNYADYMMSEGFRAAVTHLVALAARRRTAILCAERFYWKCHRRLLSDYLAAQGVTVEHILDRDEPRPHRMTPGAIIADDGTVVYR